ncbi:MAG: vWA domain-containing protein, partial [Promethearchaeia archaeon]
MRSVADAAAGLRVWREMLQKGRLPMDEDFQAAGGPVWPTEPLFSRFVDVLAELQLPRFVMRHPDTSSAVLLRMLQLTIDFLEQTQFAETSDTLDSLADTGGGHADSDRGCSAHDPDGLEQQAGLEALADELTGEMVAEWAGVISGVHTLDQLFGMQHGLLDAGNQGGGGSSFGLHDGVWQHSGWRAIPQLQLRLAQMPELKALMAQLGRRPSARGGSISKFPPQTAVADGAPGVALDPASRASVSGLALSSSLSEMLPSEAVLLRSATPTLRRLFLAKKAEAKLLSYQLTGWEDTPTEPARRPRYFPRLPSAPGGPLIVCLDTSWSMSGAREQLSKALVLACVTAAHKQRRACQVVAFSAEENVMACDNISCSAQGLVRLLDFLSHSFAGGTDCTGALKHAMATLGTDCLGAADVLLVTDGELPNPPLSDKLMAELRYLQARTGLEVHGLLVGKNESAALDMLCTHTHTFLTHYDAASSAAPTKAPASQPWAHAPSTPYGGPSMPALALAACWGGLRGQASRLRLPCDAGSSPVVSRLGAARWR